LTWAGVKAVDGDCWGCLFLFFFGWEVDADAVTGKLRSKCILNYDGKLQLGVVYGTRARPDVSMFISTLVLLFANL
jgi:hypothetical protein